ncbi:hypothetical protein [Maribacter litoralis]|uniref:hypothetical protein n=1 Tax=Maribacter litoralis TaxID=2059726 RepID=UPI0013E0B642|nr:hypothetical protein [Maribacter litoralis]
MNNLKKVNHKTVFDKDFKILDSDNEFDYQTELTKKLDSDSSDFDQNKLNEIVLWKVNRYAEFNDKLIYELNSLNPNDRQIDLEKTKRILKMLLKTKGVQLAMASTILRFRNPKIYQIIDQRVYRIIYDGQELNLSSYLSDKNIDNQIELYLKYLTDLKQVCSDFKIDFTKADRILFMADRRVNKKHKLRNY